MEEQTEFEEAAGNLIRYALAGVIKELNESKEGSPTATEVSLAMGKVLQWGLITGLIEGEEDDGI